MAVGFALGIDRAARALMNRELDGGVNSPRTGIAGQQRSILSARIEPITLMIGIAALLLVKPFWHTVFFCLVIDSKQPFV